MNDKFEFFEWTSDKNYKLRGSIHVTNNRDRSPWFIICHGLTGHRIGPGYLFVKLSRYLSDNGFSSLRFDFFGSGESDGLFHEMSVQTMLSDLNLIFNKVKELYNPPSIILIGHSFGGLIASLALDQLQPSGLVLISPVGSPQKLIQTRQSLIQSGVNANGFIENGPHEMSIEALHDFKNYDPFKSISHFKGKLLAIHGSKDLSISSEESMEYMKVAQSAGIDSTYHLIEGADHNFSRVSDSKMLCQTITSWAKERFR